MPLLITGRPSIFILATITSRKLQQRKIHVIAKSHTFSKAESSARSPVNCLLSWNPSEVMKSQSISMFASRLIQAFLILLKSCFGAHKYGKRYFVWRLACIRWGSVRTESHRCPRSTSPEFAFLVVVYPLLSKFKTHDQVTCGAYM